MIFNQHIAFKTYIDSLETKTDKVRVIKDFNKNRHRLINFKGKNYYLVFKRDFFNTFYKQFEVFYDNYPELGKQGESINAESLKTCIKYNVSDIIFIHSDGFYSITPLQLVKFCKKFDLLRTQDKNNKYKGQNGVYNKVNEETYSFPIGLLRVV